MTYLEWTKDHGNKHKAIMQKLKNRTDDEVIEYFNYENMIKEEKDFCLLYAQNKKCHDIDNLNCYICACPYFRFKDEVGFKQVDGKTLFSYCSIDSKKGKTFESEQAIHQDCSDCVIPHKKKYIKKVFDRDWRMMIKQSNI